MMNKLQLKVKSSSFGKIELADESILALRIAVVSVNKAPGFSPFGGINITVKTVGGIAVEKLPDDLKKTVSDKPIMPAGDNPLDGWEYINAVKQEPASEEIEAVIDNKNYIIQVEAEVVMVARNLKYRTQDWEPLYFANWNYKVRWNPIGA